MGRDAHDLMLLSIHPVHAADILGGRKTVELRRKRPLIEPGQMVLLYAASPVCAVVGACRVSAFEVGTTETIRTKHLKNAAISASAFDRYFHGAARATALILESAMAMQSPVPLSALRRSPATAPVQSWRFVSPSSLAPLLAEADRRTLVALSRPS